MSDTITVYEIENDEGQKGYYFWKATGEGETVIRSIEVDRAFIGYILLDIDDETKDLIATEFMELE